MVSFTVPVVSIGRLANHSVLSVRVVMTVLSAVSLVRTAVGLGCQLLVVAVVLLVAVPTVARVHAVIVAVPGRTVLPTVRALRTVVVVLFHAVVTVGRVPVTVPAACLVF